MSMPDRAQGVTAQTELRRLALPALIVVLTFLAFLPALRNGFVNWDDELNFLKNPYYRGLGWTQIRWMFGASASYGHYIPLTWLTLGLDYVLWGINPLGYHLENLLLHCANAAIFFFVSRRLLALAAPARANVDEAGLDCAAAFSALFFSLHPLRVESVAWATERRDVLSGLFYMLMVLFYLKAYVEEREPQGRRWLRLSAAVFALALLAKISGITFPLVLLGLDIYPLRRLPGDARRWLAPDVRHIWFEKIPFFLLSAAAGIAGMIAEANCGSIASLEAVGFVGRIALAAFSAAFNLWKTLVPTHLLPFYERPFPFDPALWPFALSGLIVVALSAALYGSRRRFPAGLAAWAVYLIILLPVSGLVTNGEQLAADRYSYLPCLGWAVLAGGGFWALQRRARAWRQAAAGVLLVLAVLTWRQTLIWHDSDKMWRHVLAISPDTAVAHNCLGMDLWARGRVAEAMDQYEEALRIRPIYNPMANSNLGIALQSLGKNAEAMEQFNEALAFAPGNAETHNNLGVVLQRQGQVAEAIAQYREALRLDPNFAVARGNLAAAHNNWGVALAGQGRSDEAIAQYREALRINPDMAETRQDLGLALVRQGKLEEAVSQFREALRIRPEYGDSRYSLGLALADLEKRQHAKPPQR
jgi:tetratricopeptide (TPR) repeat protein